MIINKGDTIKLTDGEIHKVVRIWNKEKDILVDSSLGIEDNKYFVLIEAEDSEYNNFPYGFVQPEYIEEVVE